MTEGEETAEKNKTDEEKKTEETEEKKDDEKVRVNIQKSYELCCIHALKNDNEHFIIRASVSTYMCAFCARRKPKRSQRKRSKMT